MKTQNNLKQELMLIKRKLKRTEDIIKSAKKLYKKNLFYETIEILRTAVLSDYITPEIKWLLARCYLCLSNEKHDVEYEDLCIQYFKEALNLDMKKSLRKKIEKEYSRVTEQFFGMSDDEINAVKKASSLEKRHIVSPKTWFTLGSNFDITKDTQFVLNAYLNALKIAPNYIPAIFRIGYIYQNNLHNEETARRYYARLVKLQPQDNDFESYATNAKNILDGCSQLCQIYFDSNDHKKVLFLLDKALSLKKYIPETMYRPAIKKITYYALKSAEKLNVEKKLEIYIQNKHNMSISALAVK